LEKQYEIDVKNLIVKHPLQPFSKKYFDGTLNTYDSRWNRPLQNGKSIWEWQCDAEEQEQEKDVDVLYKILVDAPKYFLKTICNIELPEQVNLLKGIEPFIVEKGLDQWSLIDLVLNDEKIKIEIEIKKIRGDLPHGKFADKIIEDVKKTANELRERAKDEELGTFWIYPSTDKGKYRLKHWLEHLNLNANKNRATKMFLKDSTVMLAGMPEEKANNILEKLWSLKQELEKRMRPIFPNAAYAYIATNKIAKAEEIIFKDAEYSKYAKILLGDAESLKDLGIEDDFVKYSGRLFENYEATCNTF
jgi:exonuclease V gamma subunit